MTNVIEVLFKCDYDEIDLDNLSYECEQNKEYTGQLDDIPCKEINITLISKKSKKRYHSTIPSNLKKNNKVKLNKIL